MVYGKLLSPGVQFFLAQNAPETVWQWGSAQTCCRSLVLPQTPLLDLSISYLFSQFTDLLPTNCMQQA